MDLDLANVLKVIGPAASIIFAAWIFMGFLQQRYDAAVDRYRSLIGEYREGANEGVRRGNAKDEIVTDKRRCEIMNAACITGLVSAILLIVTLTTAEVSLTFPALSGFQNVSAASAFLGFSFVIVASVLVIVDCALARRQILGEMIDVPDLADASGRRAGAIADAARRGEDPR